MQPEVKQNSLSSSSNINVKLRIIAANPQIILIKASAFSNFVLRLQQLESLHKETNKQNPDQLICQFVDYIDYIERINKVNDQTGFFVCYAT